MLHVLPLISRFATASPRGEAFITAYGFGIAKASDLSRWSQTVEKAVRPQGMKDKETNIKNSHAGNKHKAFIENALCFLAYFR